MSNDLTIRLLAIALCVAAAGCKSATAGTPPAATDYIGDKFADAQRELMKQPAEEAAPTF